MRPISRRAILALAMIVAILMLLWLRDCFTVDRCLDAGGRWDYEAGLCEEARY